MRLHCLGTTGYHPSSCRHTACYALPESNILLDAGTGVLRLSKVLEHDTLDVLLSHAHLDHVIGLTFLLDTAVEHPLKQVRIWGEPDKLAAVQEHLFSELLFPVRPAFFDYRPFPGSVFTLESGVTVRVIPVAHPGGAVGFRLTWPNGKSMAYITDTTAGRHAPYLQDIENVDLLLHECYFRDSKQELARHTGHSWTSAAAEIACQAGARQTFFIHINPLETGDDPVDLAQARDVCPGIELARDERVIDF